MRELEGSWAMESLERLGSVGQRLRGREGVLSNHKRRSPGLWGAYCRIGRPAFMRDGGHTETHVNRRAEEKGMDWIRRYEKGRIDRIWQPVLIWGLSDGDKFPRAPNSWLV